MVYIITHAHTEAFIIIRENSNNIVAVACHDWSTDCSTADPVT